jgi:hypothetical protein
MDATDVAAPDAVATPDAAPQAAPTPAPSSDYVSKVFATLKDNIDGFSYANDPKGFQQKITKDPEYADKVFQTLKDNIEGFSYAKNEDGFISSIRSGVGQPASSQQAVQPATKSDQANGFGLDMNEMNVQNQPLDNTPYGDPFVSKNQVIKVTDENGKVITMPDDNKFKEGDKITYNDASGKKVKGQVTFKGEEPSAYQYQWPGATPSVFENRTGASQATLNSMVRQQLTSHPKGDAIYDAADPNASTKALDSYFNKLSDQGYSDSQISDAIKANSDLQHTLLGGDMRTPKQAQDPTFDPTSLNRAQSGANTFSKNLINSFSDIPKALAIVGAALKGNAAGALETPLYQAADNAGKVVNDLFPENPQYQDEFVSSVLPRIGGQLTAFAAGGELGKFLKAGEEGLGIGKGINAALEDATANTVPVQGAEATVEPIAKGGVSQAVKDATVAGVGAKVAEHLPAAIMASSQAAAPQFEHALKVAQDANSMDLDSFIEKYKDGYGGDEGIAMQQYDNLHGKDPGEVAFNAFKWNMLSGVPFMLSPTLALSRFDNITGGGIRNLGVQAFKGGIDGLFQFGSMRAIGNQGAAESYETTRKILDGVVSEGIGGFEMNSLLTALGGVMHLKGGMYRPGSIESQIIQAAKDHINAKIDETVRPDQYYQDLNNGHEVSVLLDQKQNLYNDLNTITFGAARQALIDKISAVNTKIDAARSTATDENIHEELNTIYDNYNNAKTEELKAQLNAPGLSADGKAAIQAELDKRQATIDQAQGVRKEIAIQSDNLKDPNYNPQTVDELKDGTLISYKGEDGYFYKDKNSGENVFVNGDTKQETTISGGGDKSQLSDLGIENRAKAVKVGDKEYFVVSSSTGVKVYEKSDKGKIIETPLGKAKKQEIINSTPFKDRPLEVAKVESAPSPAETPAAPIEEPKPVTPIKDEVAPTIEPAKPEAVTEGKTSNNNQNGKENVKQQAQVNVGNGNEEVNSSSNNDQKNSQELRKKQEGVLKTKGDQGQQAGEGNASPSGAEPVEEPPVSTQAAPSTKAEIKAYAKSLKKKSQPTSKEVKEFRKKLLNAEPTDPRDLVIQYFAKGGKINTKDFKKETGFGTKTRDNKTRGNDEFKKRIWMHTNDSPTLDDIVQQIQSDWNAQSGKEIDYTDVRNEVIEVMMDHETPADLFKSLEDSFTDKQGNVVSSAHDRFENAYYEGQMMADHQIDADHQAEMQQQYDAVDSKELTPEEITAKAQEYDDYSKTLDNEQIQNEQNAIKSEPDDPINNGNPAAESPANAENTSNTGNEGTPKQGVSGSSETGQSGQPDNPPGSGGLTPPTREELQSNLADKKAELDKATTDYNKAKSALEKDLKAKQGDMFQGKEQKLFNDKSDLNKEVNSRKAKVDELQGQYDNLKTQLENTLEGQKNIEFKPELTAKEKAAERLAKARLAFKKAGGLSSGGLESLPEFVELVKAHIANGIESIKEFIADYRSLRPDSKQTDQQIEDAFNAAKKNETVGIAERLHPEHIPGEGLSAEDHVKRGKELIKDENYSQENIRNRFDGTDQKYVSSEDLDAARAQYEKMITEADKLHDKADEGSKTAKAQAAKLEDQAAEWKKNVVDPMGTVASDVMRGIQGETDLEYGSFHTLARAFKERTGTDLTPKQAEEAKALASQVKTLTDKFGELEKKYTDAMDKWAAEQEAAVKEAVAQERIKNLRPERKAALKQAINDDLAKLSNVQFFADHADKKGDIISTVGRLIKNTAELGGMELEDAIKAVIAKLPHMDKFIKDNEEDILNHVNTTTKEARSLEEKNIERLEKQLADLKEGITKEPKKARELSAKEKDLKQQIADIKKGLKDSEPIKKQRIDPLTHFADKKDSNFSTDEVVAIWKHAKSEYLDQGKSYSEMVGGVSMDLGLTTKQVQDALAMPKSARKINDEMYMTQRNRRLAQNSAKSFVEQGNTPKWQKFVPFSKTSIWSRLFFQEAVFAHTGVGMQTHAGMNIYDPSQWGNYFRNVLQQYKNISKVQYEKSMENLKNQPLYVPFLRAGLDIDPQKGYSEYEAKTQLGIFGKFFKEVGEAGNRGFGAVKTFRYEMAADYFNHLSAVERADPETIPNIVQMFNNATGVGTTGLKEGSFLDKAVKTLVFAPKLIASRWARLIIQPAQAIGILSKGKNMTVAEKAQLKVYARRSGRQVATFVGLLALNQALLKMSGSKDDINIKDPKKPDWMRFKWGNTTLDLSGGMVGTAQFLARVMVDIAPWTTQKDLGGDTRKEALEVAVGNYAFNTFSPVASTVAEPILRHDFNGNTVPWSNEKPLHASNHKLTWKEFLWQHAPIPAAEAAKDMYQSMEDSGMDQASINQMFTSVAQGVIGTTGVRVGFVSHEGFNPALEYQKQLKAQNDKNNPQKAAQKEMKSEMTKAKTEQQNAQVDAWAKAHGKQPIERKAEEQPAE